MPALYHVNVTAVGTRRRQPLLYTVVCTPATMGLSSTACGGIPRSQIDEINIIDKHKSLPTTALSDDSLERHALASQ